MGLLVLMLPGLAVLLIVWGAMVFFRSRILVAGMNLQGNSARLVGLGAALCGFLILPMPFLIFDHSNPWPHNVLSAGQWLAILGSILAGVGMVLVGFGLHSKRWQAVTWGAALLLLGVLLLLQPSILERLLFQSLGRRDDRDGG